MSEDFLTIGSAHECQSCGYSWVGTPSEFCVECKVDDLQTKLKDSDEKLETLVNIVSYCLNRMSSEECYNTLTEIVEHYEKLNKGDRK